MSNELQNIVAEMRELSSLPETAGEWPHTLIRDWASRLEATIPAAGGGVGAGNSKEAYVVVGRSGYYYDDPKFSYTHAERDLEEANRLGIFKPYRIVTMRALAPPSPPVAEAVDEAAVDDLQLELIQVTEERDHLRRVLAATTGSPRACEDCQRYPCICLVGGNEAAALRPGAGA